jgi:hypothetical protein
MNLLTKMVKSDNRRMETELPTLENPGILFRCNGRHDVQAVGLVRYENTMTI